MVDLATTILLFGLLAVMAVNSATTLYLVRSLKLREPEDEASPESESETDVDSETTEVKEAAGDAERSQEEEQEKEHGIEHHVQASKRPTKSEVLAMRSRIIEELEKERGTKVITMIHKKEVWSGTDEAPEIGIEDTESILQEIRKVPPDKPIDLILHTPGGFALAAEMVAMALKFHKGKVTVMVPFYAMSGGSMMSLAADEIRMEKFSVLGPVDPQIPTPVGQRAAGSLSSLPEKKPIEAIGDQMLVLSDVAKMETQSAKDFVKWLLSGRMDEETAGQVAEFLAGGYMTHSTPITIDVVRTLGLNVVEGVPDKVYELFHTFGFSGQMSM